MSTSEVMELETASELKQRRRKRQAEQLVQRMHEQQVQQAKEAAERETERAQQELREAAMTLAHPEPSTPPQVRVGADYKRQMVTLQAGEAVMHLMVDQARDLALYLRRAANDLEKASMKRGQRR